jgi:hypothetical protein
VQKKVFADMKVRRMLAVAVATLAGAVGGCSETMSLAQLPDLTKLPEKVLSKDEQQGKINDMIEKSQNHGAEAAKQIESGK